MPRGPVPQHKLRKSMNELIQKLTALGLTEEQARGAIQTIAGFVKQKLPSDYQGIVDQILAGESPDLSKIGGGLLDNIKGMFGGDK